MSGVLIEAGFQRKYNPSLHQWSFKKNNLLLVFQEYNSVFTVGGDLYYLKRPLLPREGGLQIREEDLRFVIRLATAFEKKQKAEENAKKSSVRKEIAENKSRKAEELTTLEVVPPRYLAAAFKRSGKIHTVFIDAGHGGDDPGASGYGFREKDLALSVAKKLEVAIKEQMPLIEVKLTRTTDSFVSLEERCHIANQSLRLDQNGLFVSLHVNSWIDPKAAGFEVFYLNYQPSVEEARIRAVVKRENINLKKNDKLADLTAYEKIFGRLEIIQYQKESKYLADCLVTQVENKMRGLTKIRKTRSELFFVLKGALMPAVLVELGFMSNKRDLAYLVDAQKQKALSIAIAGGIQKFVTEFNQSGGFRKNLF